MHFYLVRVAFHIPKNSAGRVRMVTSTYRDVNRADTHPRLTHPYLFNAEEPLPLDLNESVNPLANGISALSLLDAAISFSGDRTSCGH